MRAIWRGSISFGLVNIPVRLYGAVETKVLSFQLLHKEDLSPIRYARFCEKENKEVPYEDIVRGFSVDNNVIPVTPEDFEKADLRANHNIEIVSFVDSKEVDSIYYEHPYFLEPESSSAKAYSLLRTALAKSKRAGIAKFVLHSKEHLAVLKPMDNILVLNQIHFKDEIRSADDINVPQSTSSEQEINLALALIDQLTQKFNIEDYRDVYSDRLMKILEEKAGGGVPKAFGKVPIPTKVDDLMATLKKSLEEKKQKVH